MNKINFEDLKYKISDLFQQFKELPIDRKMVIGSLFMSGLIFVFGTIYIITSTVINVEKKIDDEKINTLKESLNTESQNLGKTMDKYNFENIDKKINEINSNFDNYETQLKDIDKMIGDFKAPVSSPVNK